MKKEQTKQEEQYLTKPEAATLLKVSLRTIDNYMAKRVLPFYRFGHRTVRFKLDELNAHIERNNRVCNNVGRRIRG